MKPLATFDPGLPQNAQKNDFQPGLKKDMMSFRHMPFRHMPICHSRFAI